MAESSNGARLRDQRLSATLRRVVADEVGEQRRLARDNSRSRLDATDERQMARAILNRELDLRAREALRLGEQPLADAERSELVEEVISQVFSPLPGLDRFMDQDDVVNIHIQGCREVIVEVLDGTIERHPSPFGSNRNESRGLHSPESTTSLPLLSRSRLQS